MSAKLALPHPAPTPPPATPMPPPHPAPPPEPPIFRTPDELLQDIFLRLPTAADLARASAACPSFRRLITDHAFLRRYRALHPPPLIGAVDDGTFIPAQPPNPSAVPARAFTGFDFSCSSFLPSTAGRTWRAIDLFDGRVLLGGAPVQYECGGPDARDLLYRYFLDRELAVCDPVHRRYILMPPVPGDLKALVSEPDLLHIETFLAPGDDEEDPNLRSFRVMCLLQCRMNMLLLVFSSSDGQWHSLAFDQWSALATFDSPAEDGISDRQFVHRCFFWRLLSLKKLVLLDTRTMEFSAINPPPEHGWSSRFIIVEAAEGMLGMLTKVCDRDSGDDSYSLTYSTLRNNQWHLEKIIPLPEMHHVILFGVGGGYLLIGAVYSTSSQEQLKFGLFSVDANTFQVELFAELTEVNLSGRLYAGFPPSLCAPTI